MTKLEEVLLENSTLIYFISGNCNITLENPHTAKVFKLLKANEWIAVNYEKLCNNEAVECSVLFIYSPNPHHLNVGCH
jgi:hypothetical protein